MTRPVSPARQAARIACGKAIDNLAYAYHDEPLKALAGRHQGDKAEDVLKLVGEALVEDDAAERAEILHYLSQAVGEWLRDAETRAELDPLNRADGMEEHA